jgi:hypothetical protein
MITVLTHIRVREYSKWRPVFDELKSLRDAHGLVSEQVLRNAANPNEIFVEMNFREAAAARAYMTSNDLGQGMQRAGVLPPPEVNFLEQAPDVAPLDSSTQVVQAVANAIDAQDWDGMKNLLADDFQFTGAVPRPFSALEWIGVHRALAAAIPDLRLNYVPTTSNGSHTTGAVKITGTHTGEFNLPVPGIPRVPASGNAIANPTEHVEVTVKDGRVTKWNVEHLPNGGLGGILSQMGVALPDAG